MKNTKWLYLSIAGFFVLLGSLAALDCNLAGMRDWRGNKAVILALFFALVGAPSVVTMIIQTLKISNASGSKFWGIPLVFALIFVGIVTAVVISKQYCH